MFPISVPISICGRHGALSRLLAVNGSVVLSSGLGAIMVTLVAAAVLSANAGPASASNVQLVLITEEEARLPNDETRERSITRGPRIVLASPSTSGLIRSPVRLQVRFEARGGSVIDVDSVRLTYRKLPPIDLTQRVRTFVRPEGIDIEDVILPSGTHTIRVEAKDLAGRLGRADVLIRVGK